jgi:hypothetical protein
LKKSSFGIILLKGVAVSFSGSRQVEQVINQISLLVTSQKNQGVACHFELKATLDFYVPTDSNEFLPANTLF